MVELSDAQRRARERVERLIAAGAPFLDAVLAAGERVSRIAQPGGDDHYPIRPGAELRLPEDAAPDEPAAHAGERD